MVKKNTKNRFNNINTSMTKREEEEFQKLLEKENKINLYGTSVDWSQTLKNVLSELTGAIGIFGLIGFSSVGIFLSLYTKGGLDLFSSIFWGAIFSVVLFVLTQNHLMRKLPKNDEV